MIDYIVGLFYNHRYFRLFIKQTTYYCIVIYLFGLLLDFYLTKTIHVNFFIWSESFHENSTAIIFILIGITLMFFTISVYFYNQIHQKKRMQIKLEDIAHIWTNEIDETNEDRVIKEYNHSPFLIRTINDKVFNSKRLKRFSHENIVNNMKFFKDSELYLIHEILTMLDENLNVSSVPSYTKDKENSYLDSQNYFNEYNNGKSNLELLSKVTLVEHTINVAEIAIKRFAEIEKTEAHSLNSLHLATVIIASLAHDIGKIRTQKLLKNVGFDEVTAKDMPHVDLSIEYFKQFINNLGFYEDLEIVIKSIQEHHSSTQPTAKLSNLIFHSDKDARMLESKEIIKKIKEDAEETIKKYEKEQNEKINNEQILILQKQLAEKDKLIQEMKLNKPITQEIKEVMDNKIIQDESKLISKEEYQNAKKIKNSKTIDIKERNNKQDAYDFEIIIDEIKSSLNCYTAKGESLILKKIDLLDNAKDFLKSITDKEYLYFTFHGIKEIFEKVDGKKLTFEETKEHRFFKLLEEKEIICLKENNQYYNKYIIYINENEKELSANVSLIKFSIEMLNLDINYCQEQKEKSKLASFEIKNN